MKKIYLLSLLSIFSLNLFCQIHWTKHPDNPVLTTGSPGEWDDFYIAFSSVIYHNNTYHMWYQSGDWEETIRIGHATSPDGINWTKDSNNPVMDVGPAGTWDDHAVYFGNVLVIDTIFHMWYAGHTGQNGRENYQIGHATSPDGIAWTKDPNNPILSAGPEGSWESRSIWFGYVVYTDGTFHMWYTGWNESNDPNAVGHATSLDGVIWTKDPKNPVMTKTEVWESSVYRGGPVIFDGSTYQMWYAAGGSNLCKIGYATSEDGQQWVKYGEPVLGEGPTGSWDAVTVLTASVLSDSTDYKYKMWYVGVPNEGWGSSSIGYAESPVPPWKEMKSMDRRLGWPVSTTIDQVIYVFGGQDLNMATFSSARAYNTVTNEWSDLANMPEDLSLGTAEVVNGKIYLIGGWRNINGNWTITNSTAEYDPNGDSWKGKSDCPEPMGSMASCVLNDTIYVLGGSKDFDPTDQRKAWYYIPSTDSWGTLPDMIYERPLGLSANIVDNKIYVIGGTYESEMNNPTGKAEVYDPLLKTWTELADMPVPVINHISVVHDSKIMVFGGDSSSVFTPVESSIGTNIIQEYDPSTDTWSVLKYMPFKRAAMTGQKVDNFVYLFGGYFNTWDLDKPLSEVWRFDLESPNPLISVTGISLDKHSLELDSFETTILVATVSPADAFYPSVSWTSGDTSVATVANGTVRGVGGGDVYIVVNTTDGEFKDSCHVTVSTVGINDTEVPGFKFYPNPTNSLLSIETDQPVRRGGSIEIISPSGQLIYSTTIDGTTHQIDMTQFEKGVYFVTVRSEEFVRTEKVVKL